MKEVNQTAGKDLKLSSPNSVHVEGFGTKSFSIKKARRILGKLADGISDEQIQADIDTAILFKNIFFDSIRKEDNKVFSPLT